MKELGKNVSRLALSSSLIFSAAVSSDSPNYIMISDCSLVDEARKVEMGSIKGTLPLYRGGDIVTVDSEINTFATFVLPSSQVSVYPQRTSEMKDGEFKTEFEVDRQRDPLYTPALSFPESTEHRLGLQTNLISDLMPPNQRIVHVNLYPDLVSSQSSKQKTNGNPSKNHLQQNTIDLILIPDTEIAIKELEIYAFHEANHILYQYRGYNPFSVEQDEPKIFQTLKNRRDSLLSARAERMEKIAVGQNDFFVHMDYEAQQGKLKLIGDLFNMATESCYLRNAGGHPFSNSDEMFASTATVMHFFPESFMRTVGKLDEDSAELLKDTGRYVIDTMNAGLENWEQIKKIFTPELLKYLGY